METENEETDHESLHGELESTREDMESRRDHLKSDTDAARQDIRTKVGDQRVPGAQDEQEDVRFGREAVEDEDEDDGRDEDEEDSPGGGSEGAGYREGEE